MPKRPFFILFTTALCNQCVWAIYSYRLTHWLYVNNYILISQFIYLISKWITCIDIQPSAQLGEKINLTHGIGIVIGDKVRIGNDVTIMQQVTIGTQHIKNFYTENDVPIIEDRVTLGTGSKILGGIRIGSGSVIGANAVVTVDIPPNSVAVGVPAKVIKTL